MHDAPMRQEEEASVAAAEPDEDENESDAADAPREADEEEIEELDDDREFMQSDDDKDADEDEPGPNKKTKGKKKIHIYKATGQLTEAQRRGRAGAPENPFNIPRRGDEPHSRPLPDTQHDKFVRFGRSKDAARADMAAYKAKKEAEKRAPKPVPTYEPSSSDESEDQDDDLRPVELRDDAAANADAPEGLEAETSRARANPVFAADPSKDSDELLVIQFPTELPAALPRRRPRSDSNEGHAFDDVQRLKPGKIGTLQLLASGDVRLKMGGETFDVDRGLFQSQAQQICAVDASEGQLCVLGDVETKLVCTTHVDSEDDEPMDWSKMVAEAEAEYEAQHAARMRDD